MPQGGDVSKQAAVPPESDASMLVNSKGVQESTGRSSSLNGRGSPKPVIPPFDWEKSDGVTKSTTTTSSPAPVNPSHQEHVPIFYVSSRWSPEARAYYDVAMEWIQRKNKLKFAFKLELSEHISMGTERLQPDQEFSPISSTDQQPTNGNCVGWIDIRKSDTPGRTIFWIYFKSVGTPKFEASVSIGDKYDTVVFGKQGTKMAFVKKPAFVGYDSTSLMSQWKEDMKDIYDRESFDLFYIDMRSSVMNLAFFVGLSMFTLSTCRPMPGAGTSKPGTSKPGTFEPEPGVFDNGFRGVRSHFWTSDGVLNASGVGSRYSLSHEGHDISGADDPSLAPLAISVIRNVRINRQTNAEELYHYTKNTKVEYPKTAPHGKAIGHLFDMDDSVPWISPARSFAYSQGGPDGSRNPVYTDLLVDSDGIAIPCSIRYSTCQGVKICPNVSEEIHSQTHISGSRFARALDLERECQEANTSLDRDLFEKTLNYWACLRDYGCSRALQQDTKYEGYELEQYNTIHRSPTKKKRGHEAKPTCQGRIVLKYTSTGRAYLR
ncbi:hypothetical protein F5880DRAFT_1633798 [Lentinula raphanica]|nr:hypothetical protein F5880DRAFT_1633798 [Lentinula raphanica]